MSTTNEEKSIVLFQNKKIRRTWFNDEWWSVAVDIIQALTDSKDPANYLKDMRRSGEGFIQGWGQIATPPFSRYHWWKTKKLIVFQQKVLFV